MSARLQISCQDTLHVVLPHHILRSESYCILIPIETEAIECARKTVFSSCWRIPSIKEIEENEISRKNNMTLFFNYLGTSFLDFFGGNQVSGWSALQLRRSIAWSSDRQTDATLFGAHIPSTQLRRVSVIIEGFLISSRYNLRTHLRQSRYPRSCDT